MLACQSARTSIRHDWRLSRRPRVPSSNDVRVKQHDTPSKGRSMHAISGFARGECIVSEPPLVRGRCTVDRCPGCPSTFVGASGKHASGCFWRTVEQQAGFRPVVSWFHGVCATLDQQPARNRANHVRICCLLAICIQAAATASLRAWLLQALRPSVVDVDDASNPIINPIIQSTHDFSLKFAAKIPSPPESDTPGAPTMSPIAWTHELYRLLHNLQTNLFEIDSHTIGIYPSAFLYEHSCRPNARMDHGRRGVGAEDCLTLTAITPIAAGEAVTFCYCDDGPEASGLTGLSHEVLSERREFIRRSLGFHCLCAACKEDERLERRNPRVFLDLAIGGKRAGRVELSLRADLAPRTCEYASRLAVNPGCEACACLHRPGMLTRTPATRGAMCSQEFPRAVHRRARRDQ